MAKSNIKLHDINDIRHLYVKATSQKTSTVEKDNAKNELKRIVNDMRKIANRRMSDLRKAGYDYGTTYDTAQQWIEQHYGERARTFHAPKVDTPQDLAVTYEEALKLLSFVNSKESTVGQQRAIERKRFETYRRESEIARTMTDSELRNFLKFMGNTSLHDYMDFYEESGQLRDMVMSIFSSGYESKLNDLFEEYQTYLDDLKSGISGSKAGGKSTYEVYEALTELYNSESTQNTLRKAFSAEYENIKKRRR